MDIDLTVDMDLKHLGARSELIAAVWLLERGFEVFRNISTAGPIDLVAVDANGCTHLFDVKSETTQGTSIKGRSLVQRQMGVKILVLERWNENNCRIQGEFSFPETELQAVTIAK